IERGVSGACGLVRVVVRAQVSAVDDSSVRGLGGVRRGGPPGGGRARRLLLRDELERIESAHDVRALLGAAAGRARLRTGARLAAVEHRGCRRSADSGAAGVRDPGGTATALPSFIPDWLVRDRAGAGVAALSSRDRLLRHGSIDCDGYSGGIWTEIGRAHV